MQPKMRHPDFIGIRKSQGKGDGNFAMVFFYGINLISKVSACLGYKGKDFINIISFSHYLISLNYIKLKIITFPEKLNNKNNLED
jgi:hypothetical protein